MMLREETSKRFKVLFKNSMISRASQLSLLPNSALSPASMKSGLPDDLNTHVLISGSLARM